MVTRSHHKSAYLVGVLLYYCATGMFVLTLGKTLLDQTGSLAYFAYYLVFESLLFILLQGKAGVLVDRYGPKYSLVFPLFVVSLCLGSFFGQAIHDISGMFGFIFLLLMNLSKPFIRTGLSSFPKFLVSDEQLAKLNSQGMASMQLGNIIGLLLAGYLIAYQLDFWIIIALSSCYLLSGLVFMTCRFSKDITQKAISSWLDGLSYLSRKENRYLAVLVVLSSLDYAAIMVFNITLFPLVMHVFDGDPRWISYLDISFSLGAIFLVTFFIKKILKPKPWFFALSSITFGFLLFIYGEKHSPLLILFLVALTSGVLNFCIVSWNSEIQRQTEKCHIGRVSAAKFLVISLVTTCSAFVFSKLEPLGFEISCQIFGISSIILGVSCTVGVYCFRSEKIKTLNKI
jgi:MFS transporter, DHA3 family, macrolide efflux protein